MSPAELAGLESFAVRREVAVGKLDVLSNHPNNNALITRLSDSPYPTTRLSEFIKSIAGGATPKRSDASLYRDSGIRFLRILNINDGEIVEQDMNYIAEAIHNGPLGRSRLAENDVLLTITGRVGSAAVVKKEHLPANINQHIARLRIDTKRCRPEFLSEWLNCSAGLALSNQAVSGGTRPALTYGAIRNIQMPLPDSLEVQDELLTDLDTARAERDTKLAEADALLAGIDDFVLDALGIVPPEDEVRGVFAVRQENMAYRFDPYFHSSEFEKIDKMLSQVPCALLGRKTTFSKETWQPEHHGESTFRYIEISAVDPQTGEAHWRPTPTLEAPSRARMKVHTDDIIVSLTRPHHGSIALLDSKYEGCIASTGFAVIRDLSPSVTRNYLWSILRTQLCLNQMRRYASGGNYPAITEAALGKVLIPIPDMEVQNAISSEINCRREEALRQRSEAELGWEAAKARFEAQLLGGSS